MDEAIKEVREVCNSLTKKLDSIETSVTEIKTVLIGIPDTEANGLCGEVKRCKESINKLFSENKKIWAAIIALGGGTGGTVYGIIKLLTG